MHTSNACAVAAWPGSEFPTSQLRELIHRGSVRRFPGPYELRPPREHSLDAKIGQDNTQVSRTLRLRSWQKSAILSGRQCCRIRVRIRIQRARLFFIKIRPKTTPDKVAAAINPARIMDLFCAALRGPTNCVSGYMPPGPQTVRPLANWTTSAKCNA